MALSQQRARHTCHREHTAAVHHEDPSVEIPCHQLP